MLSRLKSTFKVTAIYALGSIAVKIIGIILLPIYTDKLSTEQYGMWSILEISSQVLIILVGMRFSTGMIRFYSSEKESKGKGKVVFTAFLVSMINVLVFFGLLFPFTTQFSQFFFETGTYSLYFLYLLIWVGLEVYNRLIVDLLRILEKPGFFLLLTILKFVVILLITIYLIVYREKGIEGILLGQIFGGIVIVVISLPALLKRMNFSLDFDLFKQMFKYCFPLIFSGIAAMLLALGDRYIIKIYLDYDEVGIYSLGYKISNVLKMIFVQAFQLGFLPIAFNMFNKENSLRFFSKVFTYYAFILFWAGLAISLFSKEIIHTFATNPSYFEAYKYVPLQTLAICFYGIQSFFIIGLHYAKKTSRIAIIATLVLIISIGLNLLLIPHFRLYGAASVYLFSGILFCVLLLVQSQKYLKIPYEYFKVFQIIIISIALFFIVNFFNDSALYIRIILKLTAILIYPFLFYLFGFYEEIEIERIKSAWDTWKNPKMWSSNFKRIVHENKAEDF